ncbi:armadillo-type protein [Suillus lakei]|nr:armadillo-type protein [Suillus lakei]
MGAISSPDFKAVLTKYLTDPNRSVRETCEIALAKIEWDNSEEGRQHLASKKSSDQTPYVPLNSFSRFKPTPILLHESRSTHNSHHSAIASLRTTLSDTSVPLFQRYRAMFALRNIRTPAAVDALAAGFSDDSALFKHEIAFVFGQLLNAHPVYLLLNAAEALGGIAMPEVQLHLKEWMTRGDSPRVVRESCQVAINMWKARSILFLINWYETSGQFHCANGLDSVRVEATSA